MTGVFGCGVTGRESRPARTTGRRLTSVHSFPIRVGMRGDEVMVQFVP